MQVSVDNTCPRNIQKVEVFAISCSNFLCCRPSLCMMMLLSSIGMLVSSRWELGSCGFLILKLHLINFTTLKLPTLTVGENGMQ